MDHRKQVARLGIPFEPDHRVDMVTQHRRASTDITGEQAFYPFLQQCSRDLRNAGPRLASA